MLSCQTVLPLLKYFSRQNFKTTYAAAYSLNKHSHYS